MGKPKDADDETRRSQELGKRIRSMGFPSAGAYTGVEPNELIEHFDGLTDSPSVITDPKAQGYAQDFSDTMEDGTPVETVKGL